MKFNPQKRIEEMNVRLNKRYKLNKKQRNASVLKINLIPNTYLIAYIAPNDRILTKAIQTYTQKEAIKIFTTMFPWNTIIAITLLEGDN